MQFQQLIASILALATCIVAGRAPGTSPALEKELFKRSLPPCPELYGESFEPEASKQMVAEAQVSLKQHQMVDNRAWRHPICGTYMVICISLPKGIDYVVDNNPSKIGSELGHWYGKDGSQLLAVRYWHNELLFKSNGGSAKIYPAHGTMFPCVKGNMKMTMYYSCVNGKGLGCIRGAGKAVLLPNDTKDVVRDPDGWQGPCRCYGNKRWDIFGSDVSFDFA